MHIPIQEIILLHRNSWGFVRILPIALFIKVPNTYLVNYI